MRSCPCSRWWEAHGLARGHHQLYQESPLDYKPTAGIRGSIRPSATIFLREGLRIRAPGDTGATPQFVCKRGGESRWWAPWSRVGRASSAAAGVRSRPGQCGGRNRGNQPTWSKNFYFRICSPMVYSERLVCRTGRVRDVGSSSPNRSAWIVLIPPGPECSAAFTYDPERETVGRDCHRQETYDGQKVVYWELEL